MSIKDKFLTWIRSKVCKPEKRSERDLLMMAIGAITLDELYKSRVFRRKISGTDFEQRIKEILNDSQ
jgi:hypothetical protein